MQKQSFADVLQNRCSQKFRKFYYNYPATLLKKTVWHRCFRVNFAKFLRTPFLQNTSDDCFYLLLSFEVANHVLGHLTTGATIEERMC